MKSLSLSGRDERENGKNGKWIEIMQFIIILINYEELMNVGFVNRSLRARWGSWKFFCKFIWIFIGDRRFFKFFIFKFTFRSLNNCQAQIAIFDTSTMNFCNFPKLHLTPTTCLSQADLRRSSIIESETLASLAKDEEINCQSDNKLRVKSN